MDRGAWQAKVYGIALSQTQLKRLSTHVHTFGSQMEPGSRIFHWPLLNMAGWTRKKCLSQTGVGYS